MNTDAPKRRNRAGVLPEHASYSDDGCDLAPRCLECPFVVCRYDLPPGAGIRQIANRARDVAIAEARADGELPDAIAERFGVSRRTVFRVLASPRRP